VLAAFGQEALEREPVRVDYQAPPECPGQSEFDAAFREHLGPAKLAALGELARTLAIVVEARGELYAAKVELVDEEGVKRSREVSAPTCAQAVQAIALVAALAARSQVELAERAAKAAPSAAAPVVSAQNPVPEPAEPPRAAPSASARPASNTPPAPSASGTKPGSVRLLGAVSLGAGFTSGVGPGVAPGLFGGVRLTLDGEPSRSLALMFLAHDTFRTTGESGDVRLRLLRGRLELCPIEPRLIRAVRLSPCAGLEAGSQTGYGYVGPDVTTATHESRPWAAATLAVRARLGYAHATGELGPELVVPFFRNRFALQEPERPLYEVPAVAFGAAASLGYRW
jgi:hypothetical protein